MMLKYMIELLVMFALVGYFQLKVDDFSKELHRLHDVVVIIQQTEQNNSKSYGRKLAFHSDEITNDI